MVHVNANECKTLGDVYLGSGELLWDFGPFVLGYIEIALLCGSARKILYFYCRVRSLQLTERLKR